MKYRNWKLVEAWQPLLSLSPIPIIGVVKQCIYTDIQTQEMRTEDLLMASTAGLPGGAD